MQNVPSVDLTNCDREPIHIPGSIPIGGADEDTATDFNARQTRFWLTTDGLVGGHKVGTRLEMDFQTLPGTADQRIGWQEIGATFHWS